MWTRGHEEDFNELGRIVDDHRWTYKGILPYFKRTETHFAKSEETPNAEEHGFAGPIHTVPAPEWPLTETIRSAFAEAGVHHLADVNSGQPLGVARSIWTWHQATRQAAGMAYDMSKVHIVANTMVGKILLEKKDQKCVATGIITADGKVYQARKEVIVSCGAFRTPQILMMSGIGNPDQLHSIGVETLVEIPQVGQNLHDRKYLCGPYDSTHSASRQEVRADLKASDPSTILYWKLKHPEEGLAIGSSNFPKKKVGPAEWVFTGSVPENELALAREKDKEVAPSERIGEIRCHYEITIAYGPVGVPPNMKVPMDGSIISTGTVCFLPTSRGSVNIISTDPAEDPVIDPNYLSTEHDWAVLRSALRQAMKVMDTPAAKEQVECQFQPEGFNIGLDSTDEELNARIRPFSGTWYYPGGTAAMGSVVDSECRIYGVQGLRVVDASILPKPLGAHYQGMKLWPLCKMKLMSRNFSSDLRHCGTSFGYDRFGTFLND
ncbi:MAG: hypothetical protein M1822_004083 [Bathelium mastoideum]|nr:MAG: hypothetical protein M1822_004083 [Bathelium mastoideum]